MTHLASALGWSAILLGAAIAIHLLVRRNWKTITAALRGEHGHRP